MCEYVKEFEQDIEIVFGDIILKNNNINKNIWKDKEIKTIANNIKIDKIKIPMPFI